MRILLRLARLGVELSFAFLVSLGINFDDGLAAFIAEVAALKNVEEVELLPCHDMSRNKANRIGLSEPDWSTMCAPSAEKQQAFQQKIYS